MFIDESGHPYYDDGDLGPFAMGGLVTDDPGQCSQSMMAQPRKKKGASGTDELKSSRTGDTDRQDIIDMMKGRDYALFVTSQPIQNQMDHSQENGPILYCGSLSRLLNKIASEGPDGIYRVYVDQSDYLDVDRLKLIAEAAFKGVPGKELAIRKPVGMLDSEFSPPVQAADLIVGGYRKSLKNGTSADYIRRNRLIVANRKRRVKAESSHTPCHQKQNAWIRRISVGGR